VLFRALDFDGFVEDPDWVYRWRDHEWGARGVAHFQDSDGGAGPGTPSRTVMTHILDRLGIRPALRHAWCACHADEPIHHEFRGEWPPSAPERLRDRRAFQVPVREMWGLRLEPTAARHA
jgi:hypothetical protein